VIAAGLAPALPVKPNTKAIITPAQAMTPKENIVRRLENILIDYPLFVSSQ